MVTIFWASSPTIIGDTQHPKMVDIAWTKLFQMLIWRVADLRPPETCVIFQYQLNCDHDLSSSLSSSMELYCNISSCWVHQAELVSRHEEIRRPAAQPPSSSGVRPGKVQSMPSDFRSMSACILLFGFMMIMH